MPNEEWFQALVEECDAIITEHVHNSRWTIVEGYHLLGKRILEDADKFENDKEIVATVAKALNKSTRTIYQSIQFVRKFPDITSLPEGKNISWHKIVNDVLPEPKEKKPHEPDKCPNCGFILPE